MMAIIRQHDETATSDHASSSVGAYYDFTTNPATVLPTRDKQRILAYCTVRNQRQRRIDHFLPITEYQGGNKRLTGGPLFSPALCRGQTGDTRLFLATIVRVTLLDTVVFYGIFCQNKCYNRLLNPRLNRSNGHYVFGQLGT